MIDQNSPVVAAAIRAHYEAFFGETPESSTFDTYWGGLCEHQRDRDRFAMTKTLEAALAEFRKQQGIPTIPIIASIVNIGDKA